ncbi:hypothetical protein E2C01_006785 [Portunus trituberculatus]|uniref:Uncharacterized protein n=1 Tax=Portunus trituberculatus TaxID=210409 RepID=A0A5B7CWA1_PORTR|nr:hypothetical protein [Portunus trituberculatus]
MNPRNSAILVPRKSASGGGGVWGEGRGSHEPFWGPCKVSGPTRKKHLISAASDNLIKAMFRMHTKIIKTAMEGSLNLARRPSRTLLLTPTQPHALCPSYGLKNTE